MNTNLKHLESMIRTAWRDTGKEFIGLPHPRCMFWTEAASLSFPFYSHLTRHLNTCRLGQEVGVVPEYSPNAPSRARCRDGSCSCYKPRAGKKGIHVDLCLVKFKNKLQYIDAKEQGMWCFKPTPLIAMEFKYPGIVRGGTLDKDIQTLLQMEKVYGVQLLYLCFATNNYREIENVLPSIYRKLAHNRSASAKFRIAVGTLVENEWEILKHKHLHSHSQASL